MKKRHLLNHVTNQHFWCECGDYTTYKQISDRLTLILFAKNDMNTETPLNVCDALPFC